MNDPNGLVLADATWHLFYQHYPDADVWGLMHRGHATRRDRQSQHLAWSTDGGLRWSRHAGNPVVPNPGDVKDFRDPKGVHELAAAR
jgi:sucrose-6-phosphate hydrolase SacC (GH32 family)